MHMKKYELERLRQLASQQMEIAKSDKMQEIISAWKLHGSFSLNSRPMVSVELDTFSSDILPGMMVCTDEQARKMEKRLLSNIHTAYMNKNKLITAYSCAILLTFSLIH